MNNEKPTSKLKKGVRYPLRVAKHLAHLPAAQTSIHQRQDKTEQRLDALHERDQGLNHEIVALQGAMYQHNENHHELEARLRAMDDRLTDALHQITILTEQLAAAKSSKATTKSEKSSPSSEDTLVADEHLLDNFYVHFEKWFRGTEEEIAKRQSVYLPYFTESKIDSKKYPVVDIGCGNGEFVGVLKENGIRAIGLDLNKAMIDNVVSKGLEGVQGDALSYLREQKSNSLMAVTGFHIVEHIPFLDLVRIFNECYRVLVPGGFVIFETPNPENTIVGSCNFYNDPSHLHPLPPAFLELVMKTRGFQKNEIKRLHPIKANIKHDDPLVKEMAERFFGPQDYSIISHK